MASRPSRTARDHAPHRDDLSRANTLAPALHVVAEHFTQALAHLRAALPLVGDAAPSAFDHWHQPKPGAPARLTPRQMLDEQIIAVRFQKQTQRRMSRFFEAFALVKTLPPPGTPKHAAALKTLERLQ